MKILKVSFSTLYVFISFQAWASPLACQDITEILTKKMPISEAIASITNENNDVFVVSDAHNDEAWTSKKSVKILEDLKKYNPSLDCLFLEHPSSLQESLESFENSKITWKQYGEAASSLAKEFLGDTASIESHFVDFFAYKQSLVTLAKIMDIKLFAVDADFNVQLDPSLNFFKSVMDRNKFMASEISRLMQEKVCKQGVLFVGDAHILWSPSGQVKQTVSQFISNSKLKVASLIAKEKSDAFIDTPFEFTESSCQIESDLPSSEFAILSSAKEEPLYTGHLTNPVILDTTQSVDDVPLIAPDQSMVRAWIFY